MLGGAFNPPHTGHLLLAQEARWQLGLDRVLMVPTGRAPHKPISGDPGGDVRLEMTRRAAASEKDLEVSSIEIDAAARDPESLSYTYLTLEQLAGSDPSQELVLLLGSDAAAGLPSWAEPRRIIELARIGVVARPGAGIDAARSALESVGADHGGELIEMPEWPLSSSLLRERVAQGKPLRHLVPDPVIELISERGLYR